MLPGKTYSTEEVLRILLRRVWLIGILLVLGAVAAYGISRSIPTRFRSETLIMVVPQRIPDSYVKSTVTGDLEGRLATLNQQILSRSRLERIIVDLDLYAVLRNRLPMEEVVQRMRDDVTIKLEGNPKDSQSFRVSYLAGDAKTAQKTTERLASLFIEENLRDRENLAENTNQFLESQLEDARRRLIEHEKKLEEYRSRYSGELPTQVNANLQAIQAAQFQLQAVGEASDRARERRLLLERELLDVEAIDLVNAAPKAPADRPAGESTEQQLAAAETRLQALLSQNTPEHPDVRATQRTIRDLKARLQAESSRDTTPITAEPLASVEVLRQQQRVGDLKAQIAEIDRQLAEKQEQDRNLRAVIGDYQAKLEAAPKRETDLIELTRDYTTLQATYQNLLGKREESKIAANLERRNIGEQFKVLDPARVPERPYSPVRWQWTLLGAVAGLACGVLLIGFQEFRDSSFKTEDEIVRLLGLPVLALVPAIASDPNRNKR